MKPGAPQMRTKSAKHALQHSTPRGPLRSGSPTHGARPTSHGDVTPNHHAGIPPRCRTPRWFGEARRAASRAPTRPARDYEDSMASASHRGSRAFRRSSSSRVQRPRPSFTGHPLPLRPPLPIPCAFDAPIHALLARWSKAAGCDRRVRSGWSGRAGRRARDRSRPDQIPQGCRDC